MAKLVAEKVTLQRRDGQPPQAFIWRRRVYRITRIIAWWREPGAWWQGQPVRLFLRVVARRASEGIYDLCRVGQDWLLYRIHD